MSLQVFHDQFALFTKYVHLYVFVNIKQKREKLIELRKVFLTREVKETHKNGQYLKGKTKAAFKIENCV